MKVTAQHLIALGIIDRIVPEPLGGAHRNPAAAATALGAALREELDSLVKLRPDELCRQREERFLALGSI